MAVTRNSITDWTGPYGGLPPFDSATPAAIEDAMLAAIAVKRAEVAAIADNPAPATFNNCVAALEDAGRALRRVAALTAALFSTRNLGGMAEVDRLLAPLREKLEDEIAHHPHLFARIDAVCRDTTLTAEQARLAEVIRARFVRRGALLSPDTRSAIATLNGRISEIQSQAQANLGADAAARFVLIESEAELVGLPEAALAAARMLAKKVVVIEPTFIEL